MPAASSKPLFIRLTEARSCKASFRDETGRQRWRSTGTTDRKAALALANQWEEEARRMRGAGPRAPQKALIRAMGGSGKADAGLFTQREVAMIMQISERAVRNIERRAIDKLRRNRILRKLWREWNQQGEIEEESLPPNDCKLTTAEVAAVYALAQTPEERQVVQKMMTLIGIARNTEAKYR